MSRAALADTAKRADLSGTCVRPRKIQRSVVVLCQGGRKLCLGYCCVPVTEAEVRITQVRKAWTRVARGQSRAHPGSRYARFLAQSAFDPQLSSMITGHIRAGSAREALNRLVGSAGIPADLESTRILGLFIVTITTLAQWEAAPELFADPAALVVDLVDTATAALLAPSSRPAQSQLSDQPA